jgi:hypothetical protein
MVASLVIRGSAIFQDVKDQGLDFFSSDFGPISPNNMTLAVHVTTLDYYMLRKKAT